MSKPIILSFDLTRDLWRRFYEAHYGCDKSLKWRTLWGGCCIVIGSMGFGGFYHSPVIASLLLLTGFFGVLSKQMLVIKSLRGAGGHPFFGRELVVAITPEEIAVRSGNEGYRQPWDNFIGYRVLDPGLLLYHDRSSFFFIPASSMSAGDAKQVVAIIAAAGLEKL